MVRRAKTTKRTISMQISTCLQWPSPDLTPYGQGKIAYRLCDLPAEFYFICPLPSMYSLVDLESLSQWQGIYTISFIFKATRFHKCILSTLRDGTKDVHKTFAINHQLLLELIQDLLQ